MALIIPQLTFPVLACLALNQFLFSTEPKKELWKKLKLTGYITGGVFAVLAMLYLSFDYSSEIDIRMLDRDWRRIWAHRWQRANNLLPRFNSRQMSLGRLW